MEGMTIRCYIPTTLNALRSGLPGARAVAPDERGRSLRGEELETVEFDAMCIAAALAASSALDRVIGGASSGESVAGSDGDAANSGGDAAAQAMLRALSEMDRARPAWSSPMMRPSPVRARR
jgi:hypothetical protein